MIFADMEVAIYKAADKSQNHWAIYMKVTDNDQISHYLHHLTGDPGSLSYGRSDYKRHPTQSSSLQAAVYVGRINGAADVQQAEQLMQDHPIRNGDDHPNCTCQDWCNEVLEALEMGELFEDLVDLHEAQVALQGYYAAIE
ncbi:hypothetical protein DL96DRAFT_1026264 [Flagelloscypha sp. PMI_526]|nr:hypothetical protein DL96DRAFT_1026264 [Flagelloscypha sp. PMI_526]